MHSLLSSAELSGGMVLWHLDGHRIDFTPEEYRELLNGVRTKGLYSYLKDDRPALLSRLEGILDDFNERSASPVEDESREFVLEQTILDMESRVGNFA